MSPKDIPHAYLKKVKSRLKALRVLFEDAAYSDVVREAQEIVELASKGLLRLANIDPPHQHDVGKELSQARAFYRKIKAADLNRLVQANHLLRREREMSFYGSDDFDPTEGYSSEDAQEAYDFAKLAISLLSKELRR